MRRFLAILCFVTVVVICGHIAETRAFTVYYISFSTGSNANAGTKASPWKSHPYMKNAAGCAGAPHSYSPVAGDQFIFYGGDSWPAPCFGMTITSGGTSSVNTYYGTCGGQATAPSICAGATWPSSGWTRPKFDLGGSVVSTAAGFQVIYAANPSITYVTIDNIEIAHQGIGGLASLNTSNSGNQCAIGFGNSNIATPAVGTIVENVYVHGAVTASYTGTRNGSGNYPGSGYCASGILGVQLVDHVEINGDDSSNGGVTPTPSGAWAQFMAGVVASQTIQYSKIHGTLSACDQVGQSTSYSCHDNEIYNVGNLGQVDPGAIHGHAVFDNNTGGDRPSPAVYNNAIHDINTGLNIRENQQAQVYNNVLWNLHNNVPIYIQCWTRFNTGAPCATTDVTNVTNNTMDITTIGGTCLNSTGTMGVVNIQNNICIGGSGLGSIARASGTTSTNNNMTAAIASQYGYVAAGKYSPSSSYSVTVGTATNLTTSCGTLVALCSDASGAPWFGGSPKSRPTGSTSWDMGAFQFAGGTTGPPTVSFTSPSSGNVSGSVTMTVTATPQGSATISSCQFFIDGFAFGPPDTSSPYTTTWNSVTASNARAHTLTATCTDSLSNQGSASPIMATPTNSHPNGFVSDSLWAPNIPSQSFTPQTSGTVTYPICITPYSTTANNNEVGLSQALPSGYANFSAIISIQPTGYIQVYKGPNGGYTADPTATSYPVVANTQYCFNWTINMTAGTSTVVETSPGAATIATNYPFRAAATSLGFLSAFATTNSTPDTVEVANFAVPAVPTLSFSPGNLSFPNTVATMTSMQTDSVTITNPNATISSAVVAGTGFSLDGSSTCSGTISVACTYVVDFTPATAGNFSGTLTVTGNQTGSPQVFTLSGTGVAASPTITPSLSNLDFGHVRLANPSVTYFAGPISVAITNAPTTFTSVAPSGGDAADFGVSSNSCTSTVSVSPCIIVAKFTPSRIGLETTTLVISSSDASNSPQNITLTGTGTLAAPPTAPSNSMFMASVEKVFQVPVSFKQRFTGTVPFTAMIDFVCSGCNLATGICQSCVSQ